MQKFKQKKDDCPARLSAAAAEEEEISSPPDLSVTRRFDFAEPALSAAECHAPAFPAATGHDRATRLLGRSASQGEESYEAPKAPFSSEGPPQAPRGSAAGGNLAIFVIFDIDFPAKNESDCMVGIPSEG